MAPLMFWMRINGPPPNPHSPPTPTPPPQPIHYERSVSMKNAAAKQPTSFPGFPPTYRSCSIGMGTGELTQGTYEVAKQPPKIGDKLHPSLPIRPLTPEDVLF